MHRRDDRGSHFLGRSASKAVLEWQFLLLTALLFWPLYVPLLLSMRTTIAVPAEPAIARTDADEMARAIAQVELELDAALSSLDGWAESALAAEADRLAELCHALRAQAGRIREMDNLLDQTELAAETAEPAPALAAQSSSSSSRDALDRWHKSQHARINNLTRLRQVRDQTHADPDGNLGLDP